MNTRELFFFQEEGLTAVEQELRDLKDSLQDTQPVGSLVKCCKTLDQVQLKNSNKKSVGKIYKSRVSI